ncbi:hypothetical protein QYM36_014940, partial [Artemia franciscana]
VISIEEILHSLQYQLLDVQGFLRRGKYNIQVELQNCQSCFKELNPRNQETDLN